MNIAVRASRHFVGVLANRRGWLMTAAMLCSLVLCAGCQTPTKPEKVYYISSQVIDFHRKLLQYGRETVMAISSDGRHLGGGYCEVGSRPCGASRLKELALSKCRSTGGDDCVIFAIGSKILVDYVVIDSPNPAADLFGYCFFENGSYTMASPDACHDAKGRYSPTL